MEFYFTHFIYFDIIGGVVLYWIGWMVGYLQGVKKRGLPEPSRHKKKVLKPATCLNSYFINHLE